MISHTLLTLYSVLYAIPVLCEVVILSSIQVIYDFSPKFHIKAFGFENDKSKYKIELITSLASLEQNVDYKLIIHDDGMQLNLLENKRSTIMILT